MNSAEYWAKRHTRVKADSLKQGEQFEKQVRKRLMAAFKNVEKDVAAFVEKYADADGNLDLISVKQKLRGAELENWKQSLDEWKAMADSPKYKVLQDKEYAKSRVSRLETLKAQVAVMMAEQATKEQAELAKLLSDSYAGTYYRTIYETQNQTGAFTANFAKLNKKALQEVVSKPWAGSDFSKRIWDSYVNKVPEMLTESLTRGVALGYGVDKLVRQARVVGKNFSDFQLHRLITTELANVTENATLAAYKEGGVENYEYIATLETRTCDVCAALDDGKPKKVKDIKKGVNYPPIHPQCRCTTGPYIDWLEDEDFDWDKYEPKPFDEWAEEVELFEKHTEFVKPEALDKWKLAKAKEKLYNSGEKTRIRAEERLSHIDLANLGLSTQDQLDLYSHLGDTEEKFNVWLDKGKLSRLKDFFANPRRADLAQIMNTTNMKDMVGDDNYKSFIKHLKSIDDQNQRKLYERFGGELEYSKLANKGAFAKGKKIQLSQSSFDGKENFKYKNDTVFHENGHALDYLGLKKLVGDEGVVIGTKKVRNYGKTYEMNIYASHASSLPQYKLAKTIDDDLWRYINGDLTKYEDLGKKPRAAKAKSEWQEARTSIYLQEKENNLNFLNNMKILKAENGYATGALSDILEGTGLFGTYPLGVGHGGKKYWSSSGRRETEFFAEVSESINSNKDSYKLLKEIFPNSIKTYNKIIEDILKAGD